MDPKNTRAAPPTPRPARYISVSALAYRLGCDASTARRLVKLRDLFPNARRMSLAPGSHWRIPIADVEAYEAKLRAARDSPDSPGSPENQ